MNHFNYTQEFNKELKKLLRKYQSLNKDLHELEVILHTLPTGSGKNFTIIYSDSVVKIVKTRLACQSLRDRSIRIIYAYHEDTVTFVYMEIYFKGDKENEDRKRIEEYIKSLNK